MKKTTFFTPKYEPLTNNQWQKLKQGLRVYFRFQMTLENEPTIGDDYCRILITFSDDECGTYGNLIAAYVNGFFQAIF